MLTDIDLLIKWNNLPYQIDGYLRVDSDHNIDWYIGYENINQKSLLLIMENEPSQIPSSKSIAVNIGKRKDNKWAITFRLISIEREEVFIRLCWDLIDSSRTYLNDKAGFQSIVNRYNQWARLMENQNSSLLSEAEQKGLLGELEFILEQLNRGMDFVNTIAGWLGPEGTDQDFIYSKKWHEIKTTGLSALTVGISSIEQLDRDLDGELIIYFADPTSTTDKSGVTLTGKVNEVRSALDINFEAKNLFEEKLLRAGYFDLPEYNKKPFRIDGKKKYCIEDDFPRICRDSIPNEISSLEYKLIIQSLMPWQFE